MFDKHAANILGIFLEYLMFLKIQFVSKIKGEHNLRQPLSILLKIINVNKTMAYAKGFNNGAPTHFVWLLVTYFDE